jgi:hypothetical protein
VAFFLCRHKNSSFIYKHTSFFFVCVLSDDKCFCFVFVSQEGGGGGCDEDRLLFVCFATSRIKTKKKRPNCRKMAASERLFICNTDCLLEDNPNIRPVKIECKQFVRERMETKYSYFHHPVFGNPNHTVWPSQTDIACMHCCDTFPTPPCASVRKYDDMKNIYYVYGIFCSLNCVKAYLIDHEPSISTIRLLFFTQMCINVYGIHHSVPPALPQIRLKRFGGDLTIEEFRKAHTYATCRVLEPPFVQSKLVFQTESTRTAQTKEHENNDVCDIKTQEGLFKAYITENGCVQPEEQAVFAAKILALKKPKKTPVSKIPKVPVVKVPRTPKKTAKKKDLAANSGNLSLLHFVANDRKRKRNAERLSLFTKDGNILPNIPNSFNVASTNTDSRLETRKK